MTTNKKYISIWQYAIFILASLNGIYFVKISATFTKYAGKDSWLSALILYSVNIVLAFFVLKIHKKYQTQNFFGYLETLLTKPIGKTIGLLVFLGNTVFLGVFIICNSHCMSIYYSRTPISIFSYLILIPIVYICYKGLYTYARLIEVGVLFMIPTISLSLIFAIPYSDIDYITPVLENSISPVLNSAALHIGFLATNLIVMSIVLPKISKNESHKINKATLISVSMVILLMTLSTLMPVLVLGDKIISISPYPLSTIIRLYGIGPIKNLEWIFIPSWAFGFILVGSLKFFVSIISFKEIFNVKKDTIPLIIVTIFVAISIFFLPKSIFEELEVYGKSFQYFYTPIVGLFILLFILSLFRKGHVKDEK